MCLLTRNSDTIHGPPYCVTFSSPSPLQLPQLAERMNVAKQALVMTAREKAYAAYEERGFRQPMPSRPAQPAQRLARPAPAASAKSKAPVAHDSATDSSDSEGEEIGAFMVRCRLQRPSNPNAMELL